MAKLPARLNDEVSNSTHGDGQIVTADPSVMFEGQPVACVGHSAKFADNTQGDIAEGNACVTVNGKRVALLADTTSNSGTISGSATSILIDEGMPFVHIGPNVFIGKNVSFNTLKTPTNNTNQPFMNVQLFHYDGCEKQEPIANAYYKLTSFAGPVFTGRLDENGKATVSQVPAVPYKVNFSSYNENGTDSQHVEQLRQQLQQQRDALKSLLNQIVQNVAASEKGRELEFQHARLCNKIFKLIAATGETGYHVVRDVVEQTADMVQGFVTNTVDLTNQMMDISVDLGESVFTGSNEQLNNDLAAMGQANRQTIQVAEADAHAFWWLMRDRETWSILEDFAKNYWKALSTESKVEQIEYTPAMLAIVLLTDGEALPGAVAAADKVEQVGSKLKEVADAIHEVDVAVEEIGKTEQLEKMRPREIKPPIATPFKPLTPELEEAFRGGASALTPENSYEKFYIDQGIFGRPSGAIITTRAEMTELLTRANGDIKLIMKELGTSGWEGQNIYRIDIDNPLSYNPRRVDPNMQAANKFHIPGADKTVGGQKEIAINQITNVSENRALSATKVLTEDGISLLPSTKPMVAPEIAEHISED